MTRVGFGVDRIDREEISWEQLTALIDGLMSDHTSHTYASASGWAYVPAANEVAFYDDLDVKLMMNRGRNQPMPQRTKRPWEEKRKPSVAPRRDPETLARREQLNTRLGLTVGEGSVATADVAVDAVYAPYNDDV